jgi:hypothetical protein
MPSDSEDEVERGNLWRQKQVIDGIRLDKLLKYFKAKHKGEIPSEGNSRLDMGFTREYGREAAHLSNDEVTEIEESARISLMTSRMHQLCEALTTRPEDPLRRQATTSTTLAAIDETDTLQWLVFLEGFNAAYG